MDESSFFSMDRLLEFGLGMAVATQMANSMNASLRSMQTPGVENAMRDGIPRDPAVSGSSFQQIYYAAIDGKESGPYSATEIARLAGEKRISRETYIWKPGMVNWDLAENVPEVIQLIAIAPPPLPQGD